MTGAIVSIVVPAHDEERVLPRLLDGLLDGAGSGELEIVVVANGCTDDTAEIARRVPGVRVVETPVAAKGHALALGDEAASSFPRLYVDADIELGIDGVRALAAAVRSPGVLAAGPTRELPMTGVSLWVRWWYDVWQRLPGVSEELFGRGVIAVGEEGHSRLAGWSDVMADDLLTAMSFERSEIAVVPSAVAVIRPPRTYADLLRRRTRAQTGNVMLAATPQLTRRRPPQTGFGDLARIVRDEPAAAPKAALFAATAVLARARARRAIRRSDTTWLRDASSRD
jgi:cellulose synthase/poly-beta-1,6-N-acetylglucosamine synthase-like glycosyltransferase